MKECFPKPKSLEGNVKFELHLFNYSKKQKDLKKATGADTSEVSKKTDLANLKHDVDKLSID